MYLNFLKQFVTTMKLLVFILILAAAGCLAHWSDYRYKEEVFNLEGLNTKYNDYNSAGPPWFEGLLTFVYSTDYPSKGDNFDIAVGTIDFRGGIDETDKRSFTLLSRQNGLFRDEKCNSSANEFGPMFITKNWTDWIKPMKRDFENFTEGHYLFASDRNGSLDIFYSSNGEDVKSFSCNDDTADDAYPVYDFETDVLMFASTRTNGKFDIYAVENQIKSTKDDTLLSAPCKNPEPVKSLNSQGNDTCPYINKNVLVFASDRDGGYGGFDLYYSIRDGDTWSEPVNFGPHINSKADEFRPSIYREGVDNGMLYDNDILDNRAMAMIFSSNRDGGKGGFDLYLALLTDDDHAELF